MWFERQVSGVLTASARSFPVLVVVGPRQAGKTTLLERTFPAYRFVSLDWPALAEMAETRPDEFLARHPPPVVVDEVQYAPALFRHLKGVVDRDRGRRGLFALTGSQSFPLMQRLSDSLAGRAAVVPLLGLSGGEWSSGRTPAPDEWRDFVWRGSWPGLWSDPDARPDRDRWYQGYVATYLERDVRNVLNIGSLRDFQRFLRACAVRCGRILNLSDIARDVGVSPTTSRSWLSVLVASNQVLLLEPYHRSLGKRLVKSPKLYFTDTGLAAFLAGFETPDALWTSPHAGFFWESHVIGQFLRWRDWMHPSAGLWYWQDRSGHEVDLLVEMDGRLYPIECKWTSRPDEREASGIRKLRDFYGADAIGPATIASPVEFPFDLAPGVTVRPGWIAWDPRDRRCRGR